MRQRPRQDPLIPPIPERSLDMHTSSPRSARPSRRAGPPRWAPRHLAHRHDHGDRTRRLVELPASGSRLRRQHDGQRGLPRLHGGGRAGLLHRRVARGAGGFGFGPLGGRIVARFGHHKVHHLAVATGVQALFLVSLDDRPPRIAPLRLAVRYSLIVALSLAMGVQNSSVRKRAVPDLTTSCSR